MLPLAYRHSRGLYQIAPSLRLIYGFRQRGAFFGAKSGCDLYPSIYSKHVKVGQQIHQACSMYVVPHKESTAPKKQHNFFRLGLGGGSFNRKASYANRVFVVQSIHTSTMGQYVQ